jgi:hypothetical protein
MLTRVAAVLAALTAAIHIFIGSADTLLPVLDADLPPAVLGTIHACWHIVGLFLAVSAWLFWRRGSGAVTLAFLWLGAAGIFAAAGIWQAGLAGLWILPQWTLLTAAGGLYLLGAGGRDPSHPAA